MLIPPAQLFLGPANYTTTQTVLLLHEQFCKRKACPSDCYTMQAVRERRYYSMLWLTPERAYTKELLEPVFHMLAFEQEAGQSFFIVLEHADLLTPSCANSLLKAIEEPPAGYYFILLSTTNALLSTIRSRCVIHDYRKQESSAGDLSLLYFFRNPQPVALSDFLQTLNQANITEHTALEIIDETMKHWTAVYKTALANNGHTRHIESCLAALQKSLEQLPMPGSAKLLLKNTFMQLIIV